MTYRLTATDRTKSAIARRIERNEGLAYAARYRAQRGFQFVLPAGVKLPVAGQARATAYVGPYPILAHRTLAEVPA